jgi:hypothetical protein
VYKKGIFEAIVNNTDINLLEQVSALQRRPGFLYTDYIGNILTRYISDEDTHDDEEVVEVKHVCDLVL